ncbi:MAG: type II toxin-antitoxin system YhaV family toxin [Trueperaceae bacterium]
MTESGRPIIISGWKIYGHSLFLEQLEELITEVERLKQRDASGYRRKNPTKRLAAIVRLAFDVIPQDPTRPEYRQGTTLGKQHKHWFRAKFFQQYRLFFRYSQRDKVIIFAWVNDERSKRAYGSASDVYAIFRKMLESGSPPDTWEELLAEARKNHSRLRKAVPTSKW